MMKRALLLSAVVAVLVVGCSRDVSTPRPEAFPRMEIYDSAYVDVDAAIPLSVNASATAEVLKNGKWIDVVYPRYGGEMSVSIVFPLEYRSLEESIENRWERMRMNIGDFYAELTELTTPAGVEAKILATQACCVTPAQFVASDGKRYLVAGSFSFNSPIDRAKTDSVAPYVAAVVNDMIHLIKALK